MSLPEIERPLDNTAMSAFMACPREYYMSMILHRRGSEEGGRSPALAYGGVMHVLLEWHYKTGGEALFAQAMAVEWWEKHGSTAEGDYRTLERALLDYKRYREKWGQRPNDEQARTVGAPENPMVEIAADIQAGELLHPYAVKLDHIIELGGMHYVEDHKSTSRLDKHYYSGFELSNQMMGYTRIAQRLMPQLRIAGIRLNVIHCIKSGTNFERQLFAYTREQLDEWEQNTNQWMRAIAATPWPTEDELAAGTKPWPLGHYGTNGCDRKYGLCSYHSVCRIAAPFRTTVLRQIGINPWNPLDIED